jgi:hypothetical protein
MKKSLLIVTKEMRKICRLQKAENYKVNHISPTSIEVFTQDLDLKAVVGVSGVVIFAASEAFDKISFYKLRNYCSLLTREHFGYKSFC